MFDRQAILRHFDPLYDHIIALFILLTFNIFGKMLPPQLMPMTVKYISDGVLRDEAALPF
jgi:hypothetical protein